MFGFGQRGITQGKRGECGLDCNIWSCVGAAVMAALLPGAPMHGSGRHRKPDLFLLAEGLICPSEAGREGLGRTDGRTDGRRAVWREEYYDETRESDDDCERRRSGARTDHLRGTKRHHHFAAFMHHPSSNVLLYEVALSPVRSPIPRLSLHPPICCLSPRMCASSRTTMARIIGYQQHSPLPPFLPLSVL